jgi:hypothetical protein
MAEWWTYEPSDLLLFSPRVYYRLIELHNVGVWPAQIVTLALGLALLYSAGRNGPYAGLWIGGILGLLWTWVGWSFVWERYATINWAAAYVAPLFALQGAAFLWLGPVRNRLEFGGAQPLLRWCALALAAAAILVYPLIAPLTGRPWEAAEVFGIAPDPTASATLAILALVRRGAVGLMILPALWCLLSGGILHLLEAPGFFVPIVAVSGAILLTLARAVTRQ